MPGRGVPQGGGGAGEGGEPEVVYISDGDDEAEDTGVVEQNRDRVFDDMG